jgi:hypothetical protein
MFDPPSSGGGFTKCFVDRQGQLAWCYIAYGQTLASTDVDRSKKSPKNIPAAFGWD